MAIRFDCGQCGKEFSALDASAGRETKCPDCGTTITIPPQSTLADPEPIVINESNAPPASTPVVADNSPAPSASSRSRRNQPPTPAPQSRSSTSASPTGASGSTGASARIPSTMQVGGKSFWLLIAGVFGVCVVVVVLAIILIEMFA